MKLLKYFFKNNPEKSTSSQFSWLNPILQNYVISSTLEHSQEMSGPNYADYIKILVENQKRHEAMEHACYAATFHGAAPLMQYIDIAIQVLEFNQKNGEFIYQDTLKTLTILELFHQMCTKLENQEAMMKPQSIDMRRINEFYSSNFSTLSQLASLNEQDMSDIQKSISEYFDHKFPKSNLKNLSG